MTLLTKKNFSGKEKKFINYLQNEDWRNIKAYLFIRGENTTCIVEGIYKEVKFEINGDKLYVILDGLRVFKRLSEVLVEEGELGYTMWFGSDGFISLYF